LFDCDNTLVESELRASEVCCELINEILAKNDISVRFSSEDLLYTLFGASLRLILARIQQKYSFTLTPEEVDTYVRLQEDRVIANIRAKCHPCPGVTEILTKLSKLENVTLAVISSSSLRRIRACLEAAGLDKFFEQDKIFSAANSLPIPIPKPSSKVYKYAMEKLAANPQDCLTVEDSLAGVYAAIGAGMTCLGYVGSTHIMGQRTELAKRMQDGGCVEVMWHWGNYGRHLHTIEAEEKEKMERIQLLRGAQLRLDRDGGDFSVAKDDRIAMDMSVAMIAPKNPASEFFALV
jgi:HAD superfamily hydrolase (TIGR01509 family)